MTVKQIEQISERFQDEAGKLAELFPKGNAVQYASYLIRGSRNMDELLRVLVAAQEATAFHEGIEKMEEEMDEVVYALDRLDEVNRLKNNLFVTDFVKRGYELLSIYSICCDQLIERKLKDEVLVQ